MTREAGRFLPALYGRRGDGMKERLAIQVFASSREQGADAK
jgi:hypothetical protein